MSEQPESKPKKIIADEDWKSQVEAEKQAAQQTEPSGEAASGQAADPAGPQLSASLVVLAGTLYLQGMISLGLLPSPGADRAEVHLGRAKHTTDMLQMLEDKTTGNRTPEESKEIERMLHELRLAYVEVQQRAATG